METSLLILGSVKDLFIQLKHNQHRLRAQFTNAKAQCSMTVPTNNAADMCKGLLGQDWTLSTFKKW